MFKNHFIIWLTLVSFFSVDAMSSDGEIFSAEQGVALSRLSAQCNLEAAYRAVEELTMAVPVEQLIEKLSAATTATQEAYDQFKHEKTQSVDDVVLEELHIQMLSVVNELSKAFERVKATYQAVEDSPEKIELNTKLRRLGLIQ